MDLITDHRKDMDSSDEIKGSLEILLIRAETGEIVHREESKNLVVGGGRSAMAHLWVGQWLTGTPTGWVNSMRFGDRGHDPSDPTSPKDTSKDRTQLFCEDEGRPVIIEKTVPFGSITFPDGEEGEKVRLEVSIGAAEGNGTGRQGYSEAGMYRVDNVLAAHKTFGIITKTAEFILTFRWTFQF